MSNSLGKTEPFISVIIPAYNAERWIKDAIDSALKCSVQPLEVIVVDDGSTDDTYKIASMYRQSVRVIKQHNSGVVRARKTGIESARGKYVKLLDSDDLLPVGCMDFFFPLSELYPGEILLSRVVSFSSSTAKLYEDMYCIGYKPAPFSLVKKEFLLTQATPSGAWLIPSNFFSNHDVLFQDQIHLGEEYEFCLSLIKSETPIRYVETIAYLARNHDSAWRLSRSTIESRHITQARLIENSYNYIIEHIPSHSTEAISLMAKLCWSHGRECVRINLRNAASIYFNLSKKIDSKAELPGSAIYRILCSAIGPFASENVLQFCKSFFMR